MHPLLRQQLQQGLGDGFVPDRAMQAFLGQVSACYAAADQERDAIASLSEKLQLAAFAYDNCGESMMITDGENNIVAVNPAFSRITGYLPDEVIGRNPRLLNSGRQDPAFYQEMWRRIEAEGCWQGEIWNRRKNGEIFPEWIRVNRLNNSDGSVFRHIALFSDISEQKYSEERLRHEKRLSDDIINTLPDIFYVVDEEGSYVRVNRKFLEMTGYVESDLAFATIHSLFDADERLCFAAQLQNTFYGGQLNVELQLVTRAGRRIPCHFTGSRTAIYGKHYVVGLGRDISERKAYEHALMQQATVDSLTGVFTRRNFMELTERELSRATRSGAPTSVIMLDLDDFKTINDKNGHHVGDQVLRALGDICRHCLRDTDIVGRIGGEEFAILLPETARHDALAIAERLRTNIARTQVVLEHGALLNFTASLGVDTLSDVDFDVDLMLRHADHALYDAKHSGRNRVCVAAR